MGTRNLTCVVKDGEYKVAQYGQWDGYIKGAGVTILNFLRNGNINALRNNVSNCSYVSENDIGEMMKILPINFLEEYPQFSRDTGCSILEMIAQSECGMALCNDYSFAADSLFCEYAYVVDFDKNTFEVYEGFNHSPLSEEDRFYELSEKAKEFNRGIDDEYYPVKLLAEFSLDDLPSEETFISVCDPEEDA